jgi:hypothetical protein
VPASRFALGPLAKFPTLATLEASGATGDEPIRGPFHERRVHVRSEWRFLKTRWWVVHFFGMAAVYGAGRLAALYLGR